MIDETSYALDPQPGKYTFHVTSPAAQSVVIVATRPFANCRPPVVRDSVFLAAGGKATWSIEWPMSDSLCRVRLERIAPRTNLRRR